MTKLPISVCMISAAEAHRIGKSLASVADWVSEIVVVLNEDVSDDTEKIARSYGARVYREPWKGHIDQKNSAFAKATQTWILGLDADEVVSPGLRDQIQHALLSSVSESVGAFSFPRCTLYCSRWIRHGDWYPDRQIRLCRRGRAKWGGINPHDKLMVEGEIKKLSGDLLHYSNPTISSHVQKMNYFADIFLKEQLERGKRWSAISAVFRAAWRFFRGYILRLGFLDGYPGFFIAASNAYLTLVRHSRVYEYLEEKKSGREE